MIREHRGTGAVHVSSCYFSLFRKDPPTSFLSFDRDSKKMKSPANNKTDVHNSLFLFLSSCLSLSLSGGAWWRRIRNQLEQVRMSEFSRGAPVLWCVQSYNMCKGEIGSMLTFLNTDTLHVTWMSHMACGGVAPLCDHASRDLSQSDLCLSLSFLYLSITRYSRLHLWHVLSLPAFFSHMYTQSQREVVGKKNCAEGMEAKKEKNKKKSLVPRPTKNSVSDRSHILCWMPHARRCTAHPLAPLSTWVVVPTVSHHLLMLLMQVPLERRKWLLMTPTLPAVSQLLDGVHPLSAVMIPTEVAQVPKPQLKLGIRYPRKMMMIIITQERWWWSWAKMHAFPH